MRRTLSFKDERREESTFTASSRGQTERADRRKLRYIKNASMSHGGVKDGALLDRYRAGGKQKRAREAEWERAQAPEEMLRLFRDGRKRVG